MRLQLRRLAQLAPPQTTNSPRAVGDGWAIGGLNRAKLSWLTFVLCITDSGTIGETWNSLSAADIISVVVVVVRKRMRCCWEFLARVLCLVPVCLFACLLVVVGYVKSDVSFRGLRPMMRSLDLRCFVSFRSSFVSIVARCLCVGTCAGWWWCRRTVSIVYRVGYRVGSQSYGVTL